MKKLVFIWFVVIALIKTLDFIPLSFVVANKAVFTAVILLYAPLVIALQNKDRSQYDVLDTKKLFSAFKWFFIVSLIIFPIAVVVNHGYQHFLGNGYTGKAVPRLGEFIFYQLIVVGLPEEFFFRGFLQNKLNGVFTLRRPIIGVPVGLALPVTSLIFALSHSIITIQWWHILIFFPSLLFGWLFEKTKTIWASVLFHAACNVFAQWAYWAYLR
ncbi:CPBP family intramembrane metalloprotease [bacterium]|nr:CPBP family intramembrane metalloprotease [bacterium]